MGLFLLLAAISVGGVVVGPTGEPVAGAKVSLRDASQAELRSTLSGPDGRFALESAPPGVFLLRVELPPFAPWEGRVRVVDGRQLEKAVRLDMSPVRAEITVMAEPGRAVDLVDSPVQVNAIASSQIGERAKVVLSEALAGEAGVAEQKTSAGMGGVFVRGLTGKNVAVYRDGFRATTSVQRGGVSTFFNLAEASRLDRIEIVRGPSAAEYGSDAVGGTVNLVSQAPGLAVKGRETHAEGSSFFRSADNSFGSDALIRYAGEKTSAGLSASGRRANRLRTGQGIDSRGAVTRFFGLPAETADGRLDDTCFTQYGGAIHAQWTPSPSRHLAARYERAQQDGGKRYDQLMGGDGNLIADLRNLMGDFGWLRYQQFGRGRIQNWSAGLSYNAQREQRVNQGGQGNPLGLVTNQYEKLRSWGGQGRLSGQAGHHSYAAGAEGYWEGVRAPAFTFDPASRAVAFSRPRVPDRARYRSHGFHAQDAWEDGGRRLRLTGAVRYSAAHYTSRSQDSPAGIPPLWPDDKWSGGAWSGRAGAVAKLGETASVTANYSRGFRAPNMTDLGTLGLQGNGFFETSAATVAGLGGEVGDRADDKAVSSGKPVSQLRAETSDSFETGLRLRRGGVQADISVFHLRMNGTVVSRTLLLPQGAAGGLLGGQPITSQLNSGAIYVAEAANPVLVRANSGGARFNGVEQRFQAKLTWGFLVSQNFTWVRAVDPETGLPPDIEPGVPAPTGHAALLWAPASRRVWVEFFAEAAARQARLSSLALADRRIGAARSRSNIASFFRNGAAARGLVANGILLATGETLAQVQQRVLGGLNSAPLYTAIPGYATFGIRAGMPLGKALDLMAEASNLGDRNYRGMGWGVDAAGRAVSLRLKYRF
jgi:outer membrane receptor protein involved in Fe transport